MKKSLFSAAVIALSLGAVEQADAAPMSPSARPAPGQFSATVQSRFILLADSDNTRLVYYVPKYGNVAVQSPQSTSPIPRFQVYAHYATSGFFTGQELTHVGGTLSTTGDIGALQMLQNEASAQNLQIAPAPVTKAKTTFSVLAEEMPNGRAHVECVMETYTGTGPQGPYSYQVPKCMVLNRDGVLVDSNVMYKFTSTSAGSYGTANQDISFQATTLPEYTPDLRYFMQTASAWDALLMANVEWEVKTSTLTRQARVTVNWNSIFEQASAFTAFHNNSCIDVEIGAFFQRVATCQGGMAPCGVLLEYRQANGTWSTALPDDADFVNVAEALRKSLESEVFTAITAVNGPVSTDTTAIFTLRANYEKIISNRNEVVYLNYNAGPKPLYANTNLSVDCMYGGFENGPVFWDMNNPGCVAKLGQ